VGKITKIFDLKKTCSWQKGEISERGGYRGSWVSVGLNRSFNQQCEGIKWGKGLGVRDGVQRAFPRTEGGLIASKRFKRKEKRSYRWSIGQGQEQGSCPGPAVEGDSDGNKLRGKRGGELYKKVFRRAASMR